MEPCSAGSYRDPSPIHTRLGAGTLAMEPDDGGRRTIPFKLQLDKPLASHVCLRLLIFLLLSSICFALICDIYLNKLVRKDDGMVSREGFACNGPGGLEKYAYLQSSLSGPKYANNVLAFEFFHFQVSATPLTSVTQLRINETIIP
ncbi:hypothetical protein SAY86_012025 [Trapa natans]|uniref:Uncharacterized protein n=1 Tax=Trapa natans TaxID=22666 RepID=A0AAN7MC35_TRANT|nr:hypothetical protein SAY86_012025 [Trapa natans]